MNSFLPYVVFLLFVNSVFSQDGLDSIAFAKADVGGKILYYNKMSKKDRGDNHLYFINQFSKYDTVEPCSENWFDLTLIIADIYNSSKDYINSIINLKKLKSHKCLSNEQKLLVMYKLKAIYNKLHLYSDIFELNNEIKEIAKANPNVIKYDTIYALNSTLYNKLRLYEKAALALEEELEVLRVKNNANPLVISMGYNNLGFYHFKAGSYDSAIKNFKRVLEFSEIYIGKETFPKFNEINSLAKGNLGQVYVRQGLYREAIPFLKEEISGNSKSHSNDVTNLVHTYNLIAECYLHTGKEEKAIEYFKANESLMTELKVEFPKVGFYKNKAAYFLKKGNIDSVYHYYEKAYDLNNHLKSRGLNKVLASNEISYQKNEEEKKLRQAILDLKEKEIMRETRIKKITMVLGVILSGFLFYSLVNVYLLRKQKKVIQQKNEQIKTSLFEKKLLLKEIHHRVKNNLQIISGLLLIQQKNTKNEELQSILKDGQTRIESVALVHEILCESESIKKVNISKHLNRLIGGLKKTLCNPNKNIEIKVSALDIHLETNMVLPISLIVNETINNAYKYAFVNAEKGQILVTLCQNIDDEIILTIKDDGVGFIDENYRSNFSLGYELICGLAQQMNADLKISNNNGTQVSLRF